MKNLIAATIVAMTLVKLTGEAGGKKEDERDQIEMKLLELTNAERKKEGLKPLRWNKVLGMVARGHAENMAKQQKEEHTLDGKTAFDRIRAAGYKYHRAGENVGSMTRGFELEDLMKAWMESKGHRANILQKDFEEAGMGVMRNPDGRLYIAQVFGSPPRE